VTEAGAAVSNANVTYRTVATNEAKRAKSYASSNYQFPQLLPRIYKIAVEGEDFKQFVCMSAKVTLNSVTRIDAPMQDPNFDGLSLEIL
jgi:hypothetical protein